MGFDQSWRGLWRVDSSALNEILVFTHRYINSLPLPLIPSERWIPHHHLFNINFLDPSYRHLLLHFTVLLRVLHLCERVYILIQPHVLSIHHRSRSFAVRHLKRLRCLFFCEVLHVERSTALVEERALASVGGGFSQGGGLERVLEETLKVVSLGMEVFIVWDLVVDMDYGWGLSLTILLMLGA